MPEGVGLIEVDKLAPYEKNSRTHSADQIEQLAASISEFGFTNPILVDEHDGIIAGHGRLEAAKLLGLEKVPVIRLNYLTASQRRAYLIADNKLALNAGWDEKILAEELAALDRLEFDINVIGFNEDELGELLADFYEDETGSGEGGSSGSSGSSDETPYTKKIETPIYTPKGPKPALSELYDDTKTRQMLTEIESSKLPEGEKFFLRLAAHRHVVFNYEKIAEYYAHADKPTQEQIENSALVIIDFNKAIEKGFVQMSKKIAESYGNGT